MITSAGMIREAVIHMQYPLAGLLSDPQSLNAYVYDRTASDPGIPRVNNVCDCGLALIRHVIRGQMILGESGKERG